MINILPYFLFIRIKFEIIFILFYKTQFIIFFGLVNFRLKILFIKIKNKKYSQTIKI